MAVRTVLGTEDQMIPALTTPTFKADLVDDAGALITTPTAVTGKLYDVASGATIRDTFDLSASVGGGHLSWIASPSDMAIQKTKNKTEVHRLQVRWTWANGTKSGAHEIEHTVVGMPA
jgi:hypothetical protein